MSIEEVQAAAAKKDKRSPTHHGSPRDPTLVTNIIKWRDEENRTLEAIGKQLAMTRAGVRHLYYKWYPWYRAQNGQLHFCIGDKVKRKVGAIKEITLPGTPLEKERVIKGTVINVELYDNNIEVVTVQFPGRKETGRWETYDLLECGLQVGEDDDE